MYTSVLRQRGGRGNIVRELSVVGCSTVQWRFSGDGSGTMHDDRYTVSPLLTKAYVNTTQPIYLRCIAWAGGVPLCRSPPPPVVVPPPPIPSGRGLPAEITCPRSPITSRHCVIRILTRPCALTKLPHHVISASSGQLPPSTICSTIPVYHAALTVL